MTFNDIISQNKAYNGLRTRHGGLKCSTTTFDIHFGDIIVKNVSHPILIGQEYVLPLEPMQQAGNAFLVFILLEDMSWALASIIISTQRTIFQTVLGFYKYIMLFYLKSLMRIHHFDRGQEPDSVNDTKMIHTCKRQTQQFSYKNLSINHVITDLHIIQMF